MADKKKCTPLCQWDTDCRGARFDKLKKIISAPRFICTKCGRAAKSKRWLCKPEPLDVD